MHEMSLSHSMLELIQEQAAVNGFRSVKVVRLEIGALSCVEPAALEFCFDSVTRGTIAEGAKLDIIRVPGHAWCWTCSRVVDIGQHGSPCPDCAGHQMQTRGGNEMKIKELEVA